jgi:Putative ATP-dependent DNA helicase recG C-terminal
MRREWSFLDFICDELGAVGRSERDELEIPIIALREALANALIHRQYDHADTKEQPTRIEIYSDRVEIISFGGLASGISADILNDAPEKIEPHRRNPVICQVFLNMTLAELGGSGIERIHFASRMSGLPKPLIYEDAGPSPTVKVVFQRPRRDQFGGAQVTGTESGQLQEQVQRLLDAQKLRPAAPYIFARAFSPVLRNIATEVDMRSVRGARVSLVRGPKGSGIERIAQAVAEAPKAGLPFPWPFDDAYHLNVARLLASRDACDVLDAAVKAVGSSSLLVLTESREFDRDQEHEQQAQECLDFLAAEAPTNVILVYPTDDNGNLVGTKLRRATFQDFTIEPLLKEQTQQFVREYFWEYWEMVDKVSVAADAFDDVYPVSGFIFEDDVHFNLPFLPIELGFNAARVVKGGREAIIALVEAAQHRLDAVRSAIRPNRSLTDTFARYFVTLQMELDALRANPEPQARNGLLLVTRELVSAELAASAVYVFQWPDIQAMGRLAPIAPEPYPRQ